MYKGNVQLLPVVDEKASSRECECDCEDVSSLLSRLLFSPLLLSAPSLHALLCPADAMACSLHAARLPHTDAWTESSRRRTQRTGRVRVGARWSVRRDRTGGV